MCNVGNNDPILPIDRKPSTVSLIKLDTCVARSQDIFANAIDDEIVMASVDTEKYFGLDAVGSHIWNLIEEPKKVSELCNSLVQSFEVDDSTCHRDVLAFLETLYQEKIIQIVQP